ncbi:DUF4326 domain-containing protein [Microbispora sp. ATCC PTA-5024]|uniref:DUF4326 domain-containing protein n=1 Tax=Microbispora sp. ATCC PTA-5024 TaxID=316330 RepID=UPI0003DC2245|nr:DUF4326 domain-containing protein [Microbispora sp. ATCC PTA-5024]ETK36157.1 hypothetical protein MPTA5024_11060 [Microbispora sp. ATCC PTA-5024]
MPERIQRRRTKGWRLPEGAVIVDRTSRWGNPFKVGSLVMEPGPYNSPTCPYSGFMEPGTYRWTGMGGPYGYVIREVRDAEDATALFRAYVEFHDDEWPPEGIRRELGGKDLACFCALPADGEPDHCHRSVLMEIANSEEPAHV